MNQLMKFIRGILNKDKKNYGMMITCYFEDGGTCNLRNITEIHHNYRRTLGISGTRVAFESTIHSTGATFDYNNPDERFRLVEFEARATELSKANDFYEGVE